MTDQPETPRPPRAAPAGAATTPLPATPPADAPTAPSAAPAPTVAPQAAEPAQPQQHLGAPDAAPRRGSRLPAWMTATGLLAAGTIAFLVLVVGGIGFAIGRATADDHGGPQMTRFDERPGPGFGPGPGGARPDGPRNR